jgi:hypothetical protein
MIKSKFLGCALFAITLVAFLAAGVNAEQPKQTKQTPKASKAAKSRGKEGPPPVRMGLEPKAMEILKAACDRLAAARTMKFTAVVSYESPSRLGTPLVYTTKSEVTMQRPDKLRVITPADGLAQEFYYDGKKITAFSPAENLVAVAEAPPTIDAALQMAHNKAAIYFPFTDVIVDDPYKAIADGLILAFYMGQSHVVGGTTTDMVAYANNDVFIQIWIGAEDKLPRRLRGVYRTDPARLRHQMELLDWQLDITVPAEAFAATRAANANPISFAHPNPKPAPGAKPPAKVKTSKSKGKTE